jgi:hypothetical protein
MKLNEHLADDAGITHHDLKIITERRQGSNR